MIFLIIVICLIILYFIYQSEFKTLNLGNLSMITGGVKKGKSQLAVAMTFILYRKERIKWRIRCLKKKLGSKKIKDEDLEEPLVYSNVPVGKCGFKKLVPLSYNLITFKERFRYKSIVYINEASLLNGCMDVKDEEVNDILTRFYKLCAHELRGGTVISDTQNELDVHFGEKRSITTYYKIIDRKPIKIFGFEICAVLYVREMMLSAGDRSEQVINDDIQDAENNGLKRGYKYVIWRKWFKYYDCYCYSALTDHLPVADKTVVVGRDKKAKSVLSIKNYIRKKREEEKRCS